MSSHSDEPGRPDEGTATGAPAARGGQQMPPGPLRLRYAAVSDVGRHRKDNQDSGFAGERLLVVADGVGGQAFGDVASSTAVDLLRRLDQPGPGAEPTAPEQSLSVLAGVVHRVHDRLAELVEQDSDLEGTSTTLTAGLFDGSTLALAHVGDSRAYLLRGGELRQLTTDHTFVQTLVDEGRITEEESRVHPHRNIILKAVDGVHETDPDLFSVELAAGDRVMLCSDGCSGALDNRAITQLLGQGSVDYAAVELVRAALDAGSTDNVTVIVAAVVDAATAEDPDAAATAVGPMLVGAAAEQPRRGMLSRIPFRGRQHDTGELDPVSDEVDPEELRYAPRAPQHRRRLRLALMVLVPLLLLATAVFAGYSWTQKQYYVAADGPLVAIYKGVQMELPGLELSTVYETSALRLERLPEYNQGLVEKGIVADSLTDAKKIVANLEDDARDKADQECREQRRRLQKQREQRSPSAGGTASAEATPSPDACAGAPASDSTGGASPSATATAGAS